MIVALYVLLGLAIFAMAGLWFLRNVWFHRDPDQSQTPQEDDAIRSPVYGRVAYIRKIENASVESVKLGERIPIKDITYEDWPEDVGNGGGWLIGVAMTPLDVHFQYAPLAGDMGRIHHYQHGRNLPMFDLWEYIKITWLRRWIQLFAKRYTFENERQTMWVVGKHAKVGLVLIADKFVAKITTFVKTGETVPAGGKLSFIGRGSQVDVVVCGHGDLQVLVKEGDYVCGPLSVLARLTPQESPVKSPENAVSVSS